MSRDPNDVVSCQRGNQSQSSQQYSRNDSNTGNYSVAMGYNSTSSASDSFAMGYSAEANGYTSVAFGNHAIAIGDYSFAFGDYIDASGDHSVAFALNNQASSDVSQDNTIAIMGGKIGIGILDPLRKLQVVDNIDSYVALVKNSSNCCSDGLRVVLQPGYPGNGNRFAEFLCNAG